MAIVCCDNDKLLVGISESEDAAPGLSAIKIDVVTGYSIQEIIVKMATILETEVTKIEQICDNFYFVSGNFFEKQFSIYCYDKEKTNLPSEICELIENRPGQITAKPYTTKNHFNNYRILADDLEYNYSLWLEN